MCGGGETTAAHIQMQQQQLIIRVLLLCCCCCYQSSPCRTLLSHSSLDHYGSKIQFTYFVVIRHSAEKLLEQISAGWKSLSAEEAGVIASPAGLLGQAPLRRLFQALPLMLPACASLC